MFDPEFNMILTGRKLLNYRHMSAKMHEKPRIVDIEDKKRYFYF